MRTLETTIGILVIIGLALGIGFGVYQTHDGKNLRDLAGMYGEMREELRAAQADALEARKAAGEAQKELAHYMDYIFGEAP
jgi:predicted negative regulator of RcsB-dependent stress response